MYYHRLGSIPHKRHIQFRKPDGGLFREEVMGVHGFAGIQSILYTTISLPRSSTPSSCAMPRSRMRTSVPSATATS